MERSAYSFGDGARVCPKSIGVRGRFLARGGGGVEHRKRNEEIPGLYSGSAIFDGAFVAGLAGGGPSGAVHCAGGGDAGGSRADGRGRRQPLRAGAPGRRVAGAAADSGGAVGKDPGGEAGVGTGGARQGRAGASGAGSAAGAAARCAAEEALAADGGSHRTVTQDAVTGRTDNQQLPAMLERVEAVAGRAPELTTADAGCWKEWELQRLVEPGCGVLVTPQRVDWRARLANNARLGPLVRRMRQRLASVKPVFGWIRSVFGHRKFLLRGLAGLRGEWSLICTAVILRRLCRLLPAAAGADGIPGARFGLAAPAQRPIPAAWKRSLPSSPPRPANILSFVPTGSGGVAPSAERRQGPAPHLRAARRDPAS